MRNKAKCHNCKNSSKQFKVIKLTHVHCYNPKEYTQEKADTGEFSAWDTLRVFSDTCSDHEFKEKIDKP